jgi:hypothetical protein
MSRNYEGMLPLRGLGASVRTEAKAWLELVRWRSAHGITISGEEAAAAYEAITRDVDCQMELKATPAERTP